jgi:hypothetical protein
MLTIVNGDSGFDVGRLSQAQFGVIVARQSFPQLAHLGSSSFHTASHDQCYLPEASTNLPFVPLDLPRSDELYGWLRSAI